MRVLLLSLGLLALLNAASGDTVPAPTAAPEDYRLIFSRPLGCERTECSLYIAIQTNEGDDTYLDFYLEGQANQWIAVGISPTNVMGDTDVLACVRVSGAVEEVHVLDSWNQPRNNIPDTNQDGVCTHSVDFSDGRISCSFSRTIAIQNVGQDLNLNNDYFVLQGMHATASATPIASATPRLSFHTDLNPIPTDDLFNIATDINSNTTVPVDPVVPLNASALNVTVPTNDPEDYRLFVRDPEDCDRDCCDIYVAVQTNTGNDSFLDFYMEGDTRGWIALGASNSENMFSSDVLACQRVSVDDSVVVVDTWNPSGRRTNELDDTQEEDIITHSTSLSDGRVICSFSRLIVGANPSTDLDLDDDYYLMWGLGNDPANLGPSRLTQHDSTPDLSGSRYSLVDDSGDVSASRLRERLIRAHGVLMVVAWPVLAFTGIFFAAWMKPALPNGEWFQVHRAFMIASLVVGVAGFILPFVANRNQDPEGLINTDDDCELAHLVIGVIVLAAHIANPIISIFRCKATGDLRWLFNLIHGTMIGLGAEVLALVNVALGSYIFSNKWSVFEDDTIFYVFLGFLIFFLCLVGLLFTLFTFLGFFRFEDVPPATRVPSVLKPVANCISDDDSSGQKSEVELSSPGQVPAKVEEKPKRKPASKDAVFRWVGLGIFLGVMLPLMITVIVLIALEEGTGCP